MPKYNINDLLKNNYDDDDDLKKMSKYEYKTNFRQVFDDEVKSGTRKKSTKELRQEKEVADTRVRQIQSERKQLLNDYGIKTDETGNVKRTVDLDTNPLLSKKSYRDNQLVDTENIKKSEEFKSSKDAEKYNALTNPLVKNWNERALLNEEINKREAEREAQGYSSIAKISASLGTGVVNKLSGLTRNSEDAILDENGNPLYYTKSRAEIDNEAYRNSLSGVAGGLYDLGNLVGEMATQYIPGVGQATYFGDIAMDKYNENLRNGVDAKDAFINATGVSIVDYLKQKALGSLGSRASRLEKGTEKTLENAFEKGFSNIIGNKSVNKILSGTSAEFLDEFTDSIVEQMWDNITINKNGIFEGMSLTENPEFWKQATYEGLLGGIMGLGGASIKVGSTSKSQRASEQAVYDYERKTGNKMSEFNKTTVDRIVNLYDSIYDKTPTSQEILDSFERIKTNAINDFQTDSLNKFSTLDDAHRPQFNKMLNDMSQVIYDTGVNIRLDPTQTKIVDWDNGTLVLNPTQTAEPLKNIVLHEISKQTVDSDTQNYILNKLKEDGVYETYKNELLATGEFDELNVDQEIVAQELDAIFQNENEIKELAEKDKGLFNSIKDTFNTLTGKLTNNRNTRDALYFREVNDRINSLYGKGDLNDLSKITGESINNANNVENVSKNASNIRYKTKEAESKGKSLERILNRSGITNYEFTNNNILKKQGRTVKNRVIDAYYENGKIMINLDSKNAINKIIGHELTHSLENSSFMQEYRDTIYDYAKTIGKYNEIENRVKDLYKNVKKADIDNELTAELTSEFLFNDKDFINDLAGNHTSLFKKIYNFIKTLFAKLKGSEAEDKLSKAMELYKNAYNQIANTGNIKTGDAEYLIGYSPDSVEASANVEIDENGMAVVNDQPENEFVNIDTNFPTGKDAFTKSLSENKNKSDYGKSNTGNNLSNDVLDFFKNTKAVDYYGRLMELYHTNKYIADPFRVFDPAKATSETGEHYQYDKDDTIIFLTPSYMMSASYGRGETPGLNTAYNYWHDPEVYFNNMNTEEEVKKFIENTNWIFPDKILKIKKNKDGSYTVTQDRSEILNVAKDISKNYSMLDATSALINKIADERFENFDKYQMDMEKIYDNTLLEETRKKMKEEYDKIENKTTTNEKIYNRLLDTLNEIEKYYKNYENHDKFQFMQFLLNPSRYSDTFETKTFNYKNEKELSKEIKWDLGNFNKKSTYVYPLYANITKPFVYDFEQTWWANGENTLKIPKTKADKILNEFTKDDAEIKEIQKQIANARERSKYLREKYEKQNLNILYNDLVTADQITTGILEKYFGDNNSYNKVQEIKRNYIEMSEKEFDEYLKEEHPKLWYEFNNEVTTNELLYIINDYGISDQYRDDYLKSREIFTYKEILDLYKELNDAYGFSENNYYRYFEKEILNNVLPKLKERTNINDLSERYNGKYLSTYDTQDRITERLWEYSNPINNYPKSFIENDFGKLETNDIVKYVKELIKNGADYDGVILKNVKDYGGQDTLKDYYPYNDLFVAFNSNQVKSVYNDHPTDSPNIDYSLSNKNDTFETTGNFNLFGNEIELLPNEEVEIKDQYKSNEKLPETTKPGTYVEPTKPIDTTTKKGKKYLQQISGEGVKSTLLKTKAKNYTAFVDKLNPIQQIADASGNTQLYAKYNNRGMSNGMGQYQIGTAQTDINGREIGKSLNDIWKPIEDANLTTQFDDYLAHRLNEERYDKVPVWDESITPEMSREVIDNYDSQYPQFKAWADEIYKYNDNQLQKMIDAGLSKENARDWLYKNYVTISRDLAPKTNPLVQNAKGVKVNSPIRKAKGGDADIRPMKEAMARQTLLTENAIADNIAGQELLNVLGGTVGDTNTFLTQDLEGNNNALMQNEDGTYNYTVYKNGVPVTMQITKEVADAIRPTKRGEWEELTPFKAVRGVSKLQRALLTDKNPLFIFTNFFKDIGDAPLNSKYSGGQFYFNYPIAVAKMLKKDSDWKQYVAKGGKENTYFDTKTGEVTLSKNPIKRTAQKFSQLIENANQFIEQAPRFNEYLLTLQNGGTLDEALYNSAEVTTNFARGGEITKALNRNGFNFLNASVQGFDKQIRNFTKQPGAKGYVQLLAKVAIFGIAPAMLNHMLLEDDDDYEELPDYIKDNYYLFKTSDNKFIRIPKGRVMSIFGTSARHTYETAQGNESILQGLKDTGEQIVNNVAPNNPIENNVISPLLSVKNNKSWNGSAIVSTRLQSLPDSEQYDEKTSSIAKWLGKTFNKSPKKIDYVLDQYTGAIGDFVLPMTTPSAESEFNTIPGKLIASPFVSKFSADSTISSKYVSEFYDTKDKLEKEMKLYSSIDESEESFEKSLQAKYLASVNEEVAKLYTQKREIQNSDLDDKTKYNQARNIQRKIDDLTKFALQDYTEGYYTDSYGIVGDKEYHVTESQGKLTWSKVDEKTKKKQEEYSFKYDIPPEGYFEMKPLTQSASAGSVENYNKYYQEIKNIQNKTTKDKEETIKYINNLDLSIPQKAMMIKTFGYKFDDYNDEIFNYVNSLNMIPEQKREILIYLGFEYNKHTKQFSWK